MSDLDEWLDHQGAAYIARLKAQQRGKGAGSGAAPKRKATPERDLQRAVVKLLKTVYPAVRVAAVTNEQAAAASDAGQRARFGAARKASGVMTGHPDLIVYLPAGRVRLWELKAERGALSPAQRQVHADLAALGHVVTVIRSLEDAVASLAQAGLYGGALLRPAVPAQPLRREP